MKNVHFIHGHTYNLNEFMKSHPGGQEILKMTMNMKDCTPLFESYHSMANYKLIMTILSKYKISSKKEDVDYTFDEKDFYKTVTKRVRNHFVNNDTGKSITKLVKTNSFWQKKVLLQSFIFMLFYSISFYSYNVDYSLQILSAMLAGWFFMQIEFTMMHDASHFAIKNHNSLYNTIIARILSSFFMWNNQIWMKHHVVMHHSFTGDAKYDPDVRHSLPYIRKHIDTPKYIQSPFFRKVAHYVGWDIACIILYIVFPGMYLGQVIHYALFHVGIHKRLWGMSYPKGYRLFAWEYILYALSFYSHYYRGDVFISLMYMISLNVSYAISIIADHDTYESVITNRVLSNKVDWGEMQVRHSSNFLNGQYKDLFSHLHGGINYQIEHHLFPGISHVHYPAIAPIVKQTCKEFDIPYVHHKSLYNVFTSFIKMVKECN